MSRIMKRKFVVAAQALVLMLAIWGCLGARSYSKEDVLEANELLIQIGYTARDLLVAGKITRDDAIAIYKLISKADEALGKVRDAERHGDYDAIWDNLKIANAALQEARKKIEQKGYGIDHEAAHR